MTLAAAQTEIKTILRRELGWAGPIITEYEAFPRLPVLQVLTTDMRPSVIGGAIVEYDTEIKMITVEDDVDGIAKHRDLAASGSLARVCFDLNEEMECGTFMYGGVTVEAVEQMHDSGQTLSWIEVVCDGMLYVAQGEEPVIPDANPPVLGADLSDVWGITIAGDILFLNEGTPTTIAESDVHSFDLTTNERRTEEISAGISQVQYHRGMDNDDGTHLFLVDDDGSRGTWHLNKIELATNTLLATRDLGAGAHTGCAVYGDSNEFVVVAVDRGSTTDFKSFNTSDLSDAAGQNFTETFGEVAGTIIIGEYAYDVVGSTAISTDDDGRRRDLDINLDGFRIQWHDLARRNDYLWVSGTQDNGDGTSTGIIKAFQLPAEILAAVPSATPSVPVTPPPPVSTQITARTLTAAPAIAWSGQPGAPADMAVSGTGRSEADRLVINRAAAAGYAATINLSEFFDVPAGVTAIYSADIIRAGGTVIPFPDGFDLNYAEPARLIITIDDVVSLGVFEVIVFVVNSDDAANCATFPFWYQVSR